MTLDFKVSQLRTRHQPANSNQALIHFIKQAQKNADLSNLQLVKLMGFNNTNKALRRLHYFEQTGQLPEVYRQKLSKILGLDSVDIDELENQHLKHQLTDVYLFIRHFDQIWPHREMIIRHRDYANITFSGLYLSVAYLGAPEYNVGMLLQHYMNGDWIFDGLCCGQFYVIGAGGSPLSGSNSCHGFCDECQQHQSVQLSGFGQLLKAHQALQPYCEQQISDKTLPDLLRDFHVC